MNCKFALYHNLNCNLIKSLLFTLPTQNVHFRKCLMPWRMGKIEIQDSLGWAFKNKLITESRFHLLIAIVWSSKKVTVLCTKNWLLALDFYSRSPALSHQLEKRTWENLQCVTILLQHFSRRIMISGGG